MIIHNDISFNISFPVGKKFVMGTFTLKYGEQVSSSVDQFMNEYDIPIYLRISLLSAIEELLKKEYIDYKDFEDKDNVEKVQLGTLNSKINKLADQYTEKTSYWNGLIKNQETEKQKLKEERISTFLYLVNKSNDTTERIINQEESFAIEFSILLGKRNDELKYLNERNSKEMEEAFKSNLKSEQIEEIVSRNLKENELVEERYDLEIKNLKRKQKNDFTQFLNDLYWLEKTKDNFESMEQKDAPTTSKSVNNSNSSTSTISSPTTNQQSQPQPNTATNTNNPVSIVDSIGQSLDAKLQRASSFFNFGFNKNKNQPSSTPTSPVTSTTNTTTNTNIPSGSNNTINSPNISTNVNNNNNNNSLATSNSSNTSTSSNNTPVATSVSSVNTSSTNTVKKRYYKIYENYLISVGVQKKKLFKFKLIDASPLQLCRPISTGEYLRSKRMKYIKTLYSDSLSAVILLTDPSLTFQSTSAEKSFIKYCNMSTELHFDSVDKQIEQFRTSLKSPVRNGDFFITKHSNLSDVQVVFHLVIDSEIRSPLGQSTLPTTSDLAKGLRNIILTASKYGIGNLTIPIALTDSDIELSITSNVLSQRLTSILSVTRASLSSLHDLTSIQTVQFSLPPSLDSGGTSGSGPIASKWRSAMAPFIYIS
ncbi:hypothetical protein DLAC_09946 [Tieghemostelium lacteum]|uniref:Uncharacterized protein n=1 Tax=Tieghemostelium lacteum TaxID=361077 RepID=A0A151Z5Q0_TIELA|nr:hypothetical protein DLAC_09946 [Tieghemostelium lacteum]|eukprot:KYQ89286.1 hypothetical protein DLAC_09946 [Tieghemostelium lacteum]